MAPSDVTMSSRDLESNIFLDKGSGGESWIRDLLHNIVELQWLDRDWDSYGSAPVQNAAILAAARLVESLVREGILTEEFQAPSVGPLAEGQIRLEWYWRGSEVYVDVWGPQEIEVFFYDSDTGMSWEGPMGDAPAEFGPVLANILGTNI
jgi:hypothetical protein